MAQRTRRGGRVRSARGSWYGGPRDSGDNNRPASGIPNTVPGIARYDQSTLGDTFEVTAPNGRTIRVRQTDIGPHPRTGRGIDINYTALRRLGYTEQNFPTDSQFKFRRIGRGDQTGGQTTVARRPRRRPRPNADVTTAQASAELRYGPQEAQLRQLARQSQEDYESDITAADAAADSAKAYAKQARPRVAQIFKESTSAADAAASDVTRAFGALGVAADPYRAVTAREQGGWRNRIAGSGAEALNALTNRQQEAEAGRGFAKQRARTELRSDIDKINQSMQDLTGQRGAFVAGELGKVQSERREIAARTQLQRMQDRAAQLKQDDQQRFTRRENALERRSDITQKQKDRELRRYLAKLEGKDKGGSKGSGGTGDDPATRPQVTAFQTNFRKALTIANQLKQGGSSRHSTGNDLLTGVPKGKDKQGKVYAAVPTIGDQLAVSMALDMAYDGHISRANSRALRNRRGITVNALPGATSYQDWARGRRTVSRPRVVGRPT